MIDRNNDGEITDKEIEQARLITELENSLEKAETQKKMAWIAILSMLFFTALLYTSAIPVDRVEAIGELIGLFFISMAGIVGAYMGVTAWMSNKRK